MNKIKEIENPVFEIADNYRSVINEISINMFIRIFIKFSLRSQNGSEIMIKNVSLFIIFYNKKLNLVNLLNDYYKIVKIDYIIIKIVI